MTHILVLNGPNLNLLGTREPHIYGGATYGDLEKRLQNTAGDLGIKVTTHQSNHEGEIITQIQNARTTADAIVINPAGYSHTSVAILDALSAVGLPVVEVHISNIHARDEFRHHSYVSRVANAVICGFGIQGYDYALAHALTLTKESK